MRRPVDPTFPAARKLIDYLLGDHEDDPEVEPSPEDADGSTRPDGTGFECLGSIPPPEIPGT